MSGEKNEQRVPINLGKILSAIFGQSIERESIDVKVGDKVVIAHENFVTYLVPKGSENTIGSNYEDHNEGLSIYFTQVPGIVIKTDKNFTYNCGHCSKEHKHDILVYYKELDKAFYTSSNDIKLVE